jgi:aminodeoxyfutalosine synthase
MSSPSIHTVLRDSTLSANLRAIAEKVFAGDRISPEEGQALFNEAPLGYLGALANFIREKRHGDKTYFNRNFHVEPTNVCLYTCTFCSYSRRIKKREDGWEYSLDDIMDIVKGYDDKPVTEVHIVGGVLPQYDVPFYTELFRRIRAHRPDLHVKALTPVEYHYIFKKAKISYEEGMALMKEAGLQSMPGGGAEIFHPEIRDQIAGGKCSGEEWLRIHEIWHELGMRSNATMLYGHIEEYRNKNNELSHLDESTVIEDLRNYAISRIYLDNFDHIKAYWPMIGRDTAQLSLAFGVDDIDGTIDDTTRIYSMAGGEQNPALSTEQLVKMIRAVGRHPIERGTLYEVIADYKDTEFADDKQYRGYTALPVV